MEEFDRLKLSLLIKYENLNPDTLPTPHPNRQHGQLLGPVGAARRPRGGDNRQ
jgi:hypothetical protein